MIKDIQMQKVKSYIAQLPVSETGRARLLSDVAAMEKVPADDRWWVDADLTPSALLRTVQEIRKNDPAWPA